MPITLRCYRYCSADPPCFARWGMTYLFPEGLSLKSLISPFSFHLPEGRCRKSLVRRIPLHHLFVSVFNSSIELVEVGFGGAETAQHLLLEIGGEELLLR